MGNICFKLSVFPGVVAEKMGIVKQMGCELLETLISENLQKDQSLDDCRTAVTHLTKTCSPEKLLHRYLELIEDCNPGAISDTIMALIPHIQTVLLWLEASQAASLGLAVAAIQNQLSLLPMPYSLQQEQADEYGLCRCSASVAAFTKPFIQKLKHSGLCQHPTGDTAAPKNPDHFDAANPANERKCDTLTQAK
ncbi:glomulin-like [Thalassophryne amazonica]|uniref:glomulin-like n=1 Tax=Thalassophryne amazonica TaxID=390379 RepID=UPI0014712BC4|nr:glomulin-like [Thalassophryne amazonica]